MSYILQLTVAFWDMHDLSIDPNSPLLSYDRLGEAEPAHFFWGFTGKEIYSCTLVHKDKARSASPFGASLKFPPLLTSATSAS
jgi:hypothetical protein